MPVSTAPSRSTYCASAGYGRPPPDTACGINARGRPTVRLVDPLGVEQTCLAPNLEGVERDHRLHSASRTSPALPPGDTPRWSVGEVTARVSWRPGRCLSRPSPTRRRTVAACRGRPVGHGGGTAPDPHRLPQQSARSRRTGATFVHLHVCAEVPRTTPTPRRRTAPGATGPARSVGNRAVAATGTRKPVRIRHEDRWARTRRPLRGRRGWCCPEWPWPRSSWCSVSVLLLVQVAAT